MKKVKVTYMYDALCVWCFGFTPVMDRIHSKYGQRVDFDVVSGGLFTGSVAGSVNKTSLYARAKAFKSVEQETGVKFGDKFLNAALQETPIILDSLPPAIALCVIKENHREKTMEYASKLLKTFHIDGACPDNPEIYTRLAEEIGVNPIDFSLKMKNQEYEIMALEEFVLCASTKITCYPSLIVHSGDHKVVVSNGYINFEGLDKALNRFLNPNQHRF